jgi:hypothetical protein
MEIAKVEGHVSLIRDTSSNAILNTNSVEYNNYITLKRQKENETFIMNNLQSEVDFLKREIIELKDTLRGLLNEIRSKQN